MQLFLVFQSFLIVSHTLAALPPSIPQRDHLVLYLPLNTDDELRDVAQSLEPSFVEPNAFILRNENGPFGVNGTSIGIRGSQNTSIAVFEQVPRLGETFDNGSWTVAFFFKTNTTNKAIGIAEFRTSDTEALSFYHFANSLGASSTVRHDTLSRGILSSINALQSDIWSFVAVTYDNATKVITSFGPLGEIHDSYTMTKSDNIYAGPNLYLGRARYGYNEIAMDGDMNEAMACFSVHSLVLSPADLRQLYVSCRAASIQQPIDPDVTPFVKKEKWPQPDNLKLFLPLNSETQLNDVSDYRTLPWATFFPKYEQINPEVVNSSTDPPSYTTVTTIENGIADYYVPQIVTNGSDFTIAFQFYYIGPEWSDAILVSYSSDLKNALEILRGPTNGNNLIIGALDADHSYLDVLFAGNNSYFTNGTWKFIALTYTAASKQINVYGNDGKPLADPVSSYQRVELYELLIIGRNAPMTAIANLSPGDAVACVSVHHSILKPDEISKLAKACSAQSSFESFCYETEPRLNNPQIPIDKRIVGCKPGQQCAKRLSFVVDAEYTWGCVGNIPPEFPCGSIYEEQRLDGTYTRTCTCCGDYCNGVELDSNCLPLPPTTTSTTTSTRVQTTTTTTDAPSTTTENSSGPKSSLLNVTLLIFSFIVCLGFNKV